MTGNETLPGFLAHDQRQQALDEIHARPFPLLKAPLRTVHLAFLASEQMTPEACFEMVAELYRSHGGTPPPPGARYHRSRIDHGVLRWERHSEFTSFSWRAEPGDDPLNETVPPGPFGDGFRQPGPWIGGGRFVFLKGTDDLESLLNCFDQRSLCVSEVDDGRAVIATDFRQDAQGLTRYLIVDRGISEARAGAVSLRLQEIETYRSTTLLGLPVARAAAPVVTRMEKELAAITSEIRSSEGLSSNRALLARLTDLAGELGAEVAKIAYRMSATRAYDEVLQIRLNALEEKAYPGYGTMRTFLARRMNPAMRTCQSIEQRQAELATKLSRAIELLSARVDIEVEQQNGALLDSMNRRASLQLRLQQTVEGLSIGAISYYLLGIVGYSAKALNTAGLLPIKPAIVVGAMVPVVVGLVFWVVRRVRKHHAEGGG